LRRSTSSQLTGYAVVVNSSFNVRGEPVVCMPEEAYRCFMRTEMDSLVMGDFVLNKTQQPAFEDRRDWRAEFTLD
jgi:carbamoyltransferase